jgi:hypothetical protein
MTAPYAITHAGAVFTPDGRLNIPAESVAEYNRLQTARELEHLQAQPERIFAYVKETPGGADITTWTGETIGQAHLCPRRYIGFGHHSYRRAVTVRIFGALYHGWYMESSGDYCRLKKAKRQEVSK